MLKGTPELSVKNTKQEMLDAYNSLLQTMEEQKARQLKPEEKVQEKKVAEIIKTADALTPEGVVRDIGNLKLEIGKVLAQLSDNLEKEALKFKGIQDAISLREKDLREIYEIEKSASSLAALLEAQHLERAKFEDDMRARKEKLEGEIAAIRIAWENEKKLTEERNKEQNTVELKKREREREEFRYAFERERQQAKDAFEYEKKQMEKELKTMREESERELAEREKQVTEAEKELKELRVRVAGFAAELDAAVKKAVKETGDRITLETKYREDLLKKEYEGEENVLQTRIASLENRVKEQAEQVAKLSGQLETSYQKVQDISVKAIEGASNVGSFGAMQQFFSEKSRPQSPEK
jgi:hypothetical protein